MPGDAVDSTLEGRIRSLASTLPGGVIGVSAYDYASNSTWSVDGSRWFHSASIIKIAILAAVFDAVDAGRFTAEGRVHVRNRFFSAHDGTPFRVDPGRDADSEVHAAIGRTMRIADLSRHMIVTSSNLATNLLLDLVGVDAARAALGRRGIDGVDLCRGVEDDRAYEAGCINQVTADGVVGLLRAIHDAAAFSRESSRAMVAILLDQQFTGGIGPGLPDGVRGRARVAHKTGDISSVSHDAGLVFLPDAPPYAIAILVESAGDAADRTAAITAASRAIYDAVAAGETACR